MCDIDIEYFHLDEKDNHTVIFTPKQLIKDVIWDFSKLFIPFSNGKRYYVYQELTFKIIDYYELNFPYLSVNILTAEEGHKNLPSIVISNIKSEHKNTIIQNTVKMMTDHINRKFSLLN